MITEREHMTAWADEERAARRAAEAVNDMMAPDQADFFLACVEQRTDDWERLVEDTFDALGWPDDDLSELWLDQSGGKVWAAYRAYRALGTGAV